MTNTKENLHSGHRQRVFNSILSGGYKNAYSHQILEAILMFSIPRGDTNPTAHRLIDEFKTIEGVFLATDKQLLSIKGIGQKSVDLLRAVGAVYDYLHEYELRHKFFIKSYEDLIDLIGEYSEILGTNIFFFTPNMSLESVISLESIGENTFSEYVDMLACMLSNDAYSYILAYSFDGSANLAKDVFNVQNELKAYGFNMLECLVQRDKKVYRPYNDLYEIVIQKVRKNPELNFIEYSKSIFEQTHLAQIIRTISFEAEAETQNGDDVVYSL